jgi:hypothetical protein
VVVRGDGCVSMERIERGGFHSSTYDGEDVFDMAEMVYEEFVVHRGMSEYDVRDIVDEIGFILQKIDRREFVECFDVRSGMIATNEGIGKETYHRYKRYREWLINHQMKIPESLEKSLKANEWYEYE